MDQSNNPVFTFDETLYFHENKTIEISEDNSVLWRTRREGK
jgi:hypothetical protein